MRILLLSDIHSNWSALQAINETYDLCIFLGDLVDYGLEPTPCIDWVRKNCRFAVRGNHDHGMSQNVIINGQSGFRYLTTVTRPLNRQLVSEEDRRFLMSLPVTQSATIDDLRYFLCHATPRDPMDEYAPADPEFWARRLEQVDADIVCVGHTHMPFALEAGGKLVVNPGSVGLPRDGNPKASYAILEGRHVELKRIDYPIESAVNVIRTSALPEPAKELLTEVYRTGEAKQKSSTSTSSVASNDSRIVKTRPSMLGVPRPTPAAGSPLPLASGNSGIIRPRATSQGVVRPGATMQGVDVNPTLHELAADQPPPSAVTKRADTRPMPIIPRRPPEPPPPAAPPPETPK